MLLAQLSVYPIGEGVSLGRFVRKSVQVLEESGYAYQVGALSTGVEVPDLKSLFELVTKMHQVQLDQGAKRILIEMKVDDRRDKNATLKSKVESVTSS